MATSNRYRLPFMRRLKGQTNYRKRRALLASGIPRAVVRKSNKNMIVEIVSYDPVGDKVISFSSSIHLKKYGIDEQLGRNTTSAYLTGFMAGKLALSKGVNECVLDIGLNHPTKGSRVFASLKGLLDAGVEIPHSDDVLPDEERINGKLGADKIEEIKNKISSEVEK